MAELAQSIASKVIALAIIVIIITAAALPAIDDAIDETKTIVNNSTGSNHYSCIVDEDVSSLELVMSHEAGTNTVTVNGQSFSKKPSTNMIFASDSMTLSLLSSGSSYLMSIATASGTVNLTADQSLSLTKTNNSVSVTYSTDSDPVTVNVTVSWIAYIDSKGTFLNFENPNANTFYVNSLDQVVMASYQNNLGYCWAYNGDAAVGANDAVVAGTLTEVEGTNGEVFSAAGVHLEYDNSGTTASTSIYIFLIPASVTYQTPEGHQYDTLISIIPILLIIVAVLFAVRMMGTSRD